tara:strand:+ start:466 stop:672 length:207 start_codon:yes stop_codon:yes gene_type:complete
MNNIDEYEAIRKLNPCNDKLGRDRDFKDNTSKAIQWLTEKIIKNEKNVLQLTQELLNLKEAIKRREND